STSRKLLIPTAPADPSAPTSEPYQFMSQTAPKSDRLLAPELEQTSQTEAAATCRRTAINLADAIAFFEDEDRRRITRSRPTKLEFSAATMDACVSAVVRVAGAPGNVPLRQLVKRAGDDAAVLVAAVAPILARAIARQLKGSEK